MSLIVECPRCLGEKVIECPNCEGTAEAFVEGVLEMCPDCDASGECECPECDGEGEIEYEDPPKAG